MRNIFLIIFSIIIIGVTACNSNPEKQKNSTETSSNEIKSDSDNQIENPENSKEKLFSKYNQLIKKDLRSHIEENFFSNYKNSIIKHEALMLNENSFKYTIVLIEPWLYKQTNEFGNSEEELFSIADLGDTLSINGKLKLTKIENNNLIQVKVNSDIKWSKFTQNPYEGFNRYNNSDYAETTFKIDIRQSVNYAKSEMYLKARFFELNKSDLKDFSKEELSYLRNEIFARHGHIFKTDKMKNYFSGKEWYRPCYIDATAYLNETEKSNAQFIKELEDDK